MRHAGTNREGLTLIEVLFASSVLAFALLGVAGMFPSAMRLVYTGGETTKATMLAREMIDMIRADAFDSLVGRYHGLDTDAVSATCPVLPTTLTTLDPDYNRKKWKCDMAPSGTLDTGQGLRGGRGTVTVTCVGFSSEPPYDEVNDPGCARDTRRVSVTVSWGAQGSRSVGLVTYVTRAE